MKPELVPALRQTTIFRVCTTLWSRWIDRSRIMYCKEKHPHNTEKGAAWLEVEDEIKAKIPELGLPQSLEMDVSSFIKPLGVEILKWCEFHCLGGYLDIDIPNEFCWTLEGTIDLKKTAERLVKDENLNPVKRHKIARIYCLEAEILELPCCGYSSLKVRDRQSVERELVAFWNSRIPEEIVVPDAVEPWNYVCAFKFSALCGNTVAMKYFWEKLTPSEQKEFAMDAVRRVLFNYCTFYRNSCAFPKEFYARGLWFLLSQLDDTQRKAVVRKYSSEIVLCFVDWPCQNVLLEIVDLVSDSISSDACTTLLMKIADRIFDGHNYYDYSGLINKVWRKVSNCYKQVSNNFGQLMIKLLLIKDLKNLRLILKDVDPVGKKALYSFEMCCRLITIADSDLFELFIHECIPLKKDMLKFKEILTELVKCSGASDHFVHLLDNLIQEHDKRKCMEENSGSSSKKLASAQDETVHDS